jgi:hypothetical protein
MQRASSLAAAAALLAACGGKVAVDTPAAGGSGGAATTTTSSSSSSGKPQACGSGYAGLPPCPPDQWCQYDTNGACVTGSETGGTCQPKPTACDADCPGVCGCDNQFYCNACEAHLAGTDVLEGSLLCTDTYRAISLFTNVPRFALLKASPTRDLCFRLIFEPSSTPQGGITGDGWFASHVEVTNHAGDCDLQPGQLTPEKGMVATAIDIGGNLHFSQSPAGCAITQMDSYATFDQNDPTWLPPASEAITWVDPQNPIPIEGGCP